VEFECANLCIAESDKEVKLTLLRAGDLSRSCGVHVKTLDGSAKAGEDYDAVDRIFEFQRNETTKKVAIGIKEDNKYEGDEEFFVKLSLPAKEDPSVVSLGRKNLARVLIIDSDHPGVFKFSTEQMQIRESPDDPKEHVDIVRTKGTCGAVSCKWRTEDDSAVAGFDYKATSGVLHFAPGEGQKSIEFEILPRGRGVKTGQFRLIIDSASGGALFDASTDGSEECCILTVTILGDPAQDDWDFPFLDAITPNSQKLAAGSQSWREQFRDAVIFDSDDGQAGAGAWASHIVMMPWKVISAMVPPPSLCDGMLCFIVSLVLIGGLTAIIGDLASMFGCALHWDDSITAITVVAIGTSLPDTFASMTAAVQEATADNSIGNVTGSNSVNVFLGLGMPWCIGSLYWYFTGVDILDDSDPWVVHGKKVGWWDELPEIKEEWPATFVVPAESLGMSVTIFTVCALICLALLVARRCLLGAELGGPGGLKYATSALLVFLWFLYIGLSAVAATS